MTNDIRRTTGTLRTVLQPSGAVAAAVLLAGGLALGACSTGDAPGAGGTAVGLGAAQAQASGASADATTADLVEADLVDAALGAPAPATSATAADAPFGQGDRRGLRARLLRALHATWVTEGRTGPVTHQAIRGEVTAASSTSVTVRARDGVSSTFTVTGDTRVRARANGTGHDSSMAAVRVGDKAFVVGTGATRPTAGVVVFRHANATPSTTPSPGTTS
jgi:hypothetical protein